MTRDDAVIGEAAGLAMGLVMIGTRSTTAIEDMLNVSRVTRAFVFPGVIFSLPLFPSFLPPSPPSSMPEIHSMKRFSVVLH